MKQSTAVVGRRSLLTLGQVCNYIITNSLICVVDQLAGYPLLHMELLTPSQAAGGRTLLRVLLWCNTAAVVAVVALRRWQLGGPGRRWIRLGLAHAALACTAATHGINVYLIFFHVPVSPQESSCSRLLSLIAVGSIVVIAAADILFFMVLLRGDDDGVEEEE